MRTRSVFTAAVIAIAAGSALSGSAFADTVYYVRATGSDSKNGMTAANAFKTIQKAIASCTAASGGYTIYVGPGTYAEELHIGDGAGSAAKSGTASKPNRIIGDVSGAQTTDAAGAVIINGGGTRDYGIYMDSRDYWRFEKLTVKSQRSYNIMWQNTTGSGLYDSVVHVCPSIGIYAYRAGGIVIQRNNLVRDSSSGYGMYLYSYDKPGSITVDANRFNLTGSAYLSYGFASGNMNSKQYASTSGAGLTMSIGILAYSGNGGNVRGDITITNNVGTDCLYGIYAYAYGGQSTVSVCNNTLVGCMYPMLVYGYQSGACKMNNNIISEAAYPYLAYTYNASGVISPNVTVKGLVQHNILNPGAWGAQSSPATGFVSSADPKFKDPAGGDFSLKPGSPARDAGIADGAPAVDITGRARPADDNGDNTLAFDLGAWEGGAGAKYKIISWWETSDDADSRGYTPDRERAVRSSTPAASALVTNTTAVGSTVTGTAGGVTTGTTGSAGAVKTTTNSADAKAKAKEEKKKAQEQKKAEKLKQAEERKQQVAEQQKQKQVAKEQEAQKKAEEKEQAALKKAEEKEQKALAKAQEQAKKEEEKAKKAEEKAAGKKN